jgi:hypothetical protein
MKINTRKVIVGSIVGQAISVGLGHLLTHSEWWMTHGVLRSLLCLAIAIIITVACLWAWWPVEKDT